MSVKRVAIIGAGCSGLTAIKCCLDEGLIPVCFERETYIGGLWQYHEDTTTRGKGGVYQSCVINTSKEMMAFSDFPVPQEFPPFMPHKNVLEYFHMYAENFGLHKYIRFNTSVASIVQASDYQVTGKWEVCYRNHVVDGGHCDVTRETFDGVMLCSGHHTLPHTPSFDGLDQFEGIKLHSQSYKAPLKFAGKRVLVVGIGNSAADISVDVSHLASQVYISTRHGAWVFSRMGYWGLPLDAIANSRVAFAFDYRVMQWCVEKMATFRFDHKTYGLEPAHRGLEAHPTINDELPYRIMVGAIKAKPNISRFTPNGVYFDDGSFEEIDAVIFATGYNYRFDYVDKETLSTVGNDTTLYKYTFPPHHRHPTLAVIGLVQAVGAVMPIAEMQSRWFTRVVKGLVKLPKRDAMEADVTKKKEKMAQQFIPSQRHTLETMWVPFMDELAEQIGVKPNLMALARQDFWLAVRCFLGPCVPAQYRLMGPGSWNGARSTINNVFKRSMAGLQTRVLAKNHPTTVTRKQHIYTHTKMGNLAALRALILIGVVILFVCLIMV